MYSMYMYVQVIVRYANKKIKPTFHTGSLMKYVREKLKEDRLLELMTGNPRSLKRICNIITLALSCHPDSYISNEDAFCLLLVIIMIEQWPFRSVLVIIMIEQWPFRSVLVIIMIEQWSVLPLSVFENTPL